MRQFSSKVKSEIITSSLDTKLDKLAFLSSYVRVAATIGLVGKNKSVSITSDKKLLEFLDVLLDDVTVGADVPTDNYDKNNGTELKITGDNATNLLMILKIFSQHKNGDLEYQPSIHSDFLENSPIATLKGFFVGCGSLTITNNFHLEFNFTNGYLASDCQMLLSNLGINAKLLARDERFVVYLKKAENIANTLTMLGAENSALKIVHESITRETSSLINRRLNCDMYNIEKHIASANSQIEAIKSLEKNGKLKTLSPILQETAKLRLDNPDSTLAELAELAKVSKSGFKHRLDKLMQLV